MDKKTGIIIGVISAIAVVLVAIVFVTDAKVEDIPDDVLLTINNTRYMVDDFNKYKVLTNYEAGDINKEMTSGDITNMLNDFMKDKIYSMSAVDKKVALKEESTYKEDYNNASGELLSNGISLEDYVSFKEEKERIQTLKSNFPDYYTLPEEEYNRIEQNFKDNDMYYSYSFRIMNIPYEKESEESGDEEAIPEEGSGENASETTTTAEENEEEKQDMSKEAQLLVAQNVVERIRSGEDFQELSKEFGSMRFTFVGRGYNIINGDLEYATSPLLESKLGNEEVYDAFLKLEAGECTEPIDSEDYTAYVIAKLESKEEGFVGEADKELREIILTQEDTMDTLVSQGYTFDVNQVGYYSILYK